MTRVLFCIGLLLTTGFYAGDNVAVADTHPLDSAIQLTLDAGYNDFFIDEERYDVALTSDIDFLIPHFTLRFQPESGVAKTYHQNGLYHIRSPPVRDMLLTVYAGRV